MNTGALDDEAVDLRFYWQLMTKQMPTDELVDELDVLASFTSSEIVRRKCRAKIAEMSKTAAVQLR